MLGHLLRTEVYDDKTAFDNMGVVQSPFPFV